MRVKVKTPARLHFGILNPADDYGRKYGSVGLVVKGLGFELEVKESETLEVNGPSESVEKAKGIVQNISQFYDLTSSVQIDMIQTIPPHVGLGSTTQLTLGLGKAITTIYGIDTPVRELAKKMGRGRYSGIGTYGFENGGFIVEGGGTEKEFPPLVIRHDFPEEWAFVVAIPSAERGPEEEGEEKYFEGLELEQNIPEKICYQLVLEMLPSLVERNIVDFGVSLTKIDKIVGQAFSPKQGGIFRGSPVSKTRDYLLKKGAYGVGQSSWGPAVYGLVENFERAEILRDEVADFLQGEGLLGSVFVVEPDNRGAEVFVKG